MSSDYTPSPSVLSTALRVNGSIPITEMTNNPLVTVGTSAAPIVGVDSYDNVWLGGGSNSAGICYGDPLNPPGPRVLATALGVRIDGTTNTIIYTLNGVSTAGIGVPVLWGIDNRTGVTAPDAAPITLYTTTAAGQAYHLLAHIFARGGTSPTGTYVVKFTEGGVAIGKTMIVSAVDTDSDLSIPCQPDNDTTITAQLTSVGGPSPSMDVYCSVKEEA